MGLGSLLFSLPHFLTGPYRYISGSTNWADNVIMILMPNMLVVMVVMVVEALLGGLYHNDVLQWR